MKELFAKKGCGIVHAAILGRKEWFLRNPYDPTIRMGQDYDLWLRSCTRNDLNVYLMQEPLYYYREECNVTADKLLTAYCCLNEIYWKYGHLRVFPLIAKLWIKSMIVRILSSTNQMEILLKRRSEPISDVVILDLFKRETVQVLQTKVPGLDCV